MTIPLPRRTISTPSAEQALTWSLTDLRRWWMSPARIRWRRTIVYVQGSGRTNFGDVI